MARQSDDSEVVIISMTSSTCGMKKKKKRRRVWSNYLNGLQRTDYSIDHSRGYTE